MGWGPQGILGNRTREKAHHGVQGPLSPGIFPLSLQFLKPFPSKFKTNPESQSHFLPSVLILPFCFPSCMWTPVSSSDLTCPALLSLLFSWFLYPLLLSPAPIMSQSYQSLWPREAPVRGCSCRITPSQPRFGACFLPITVTGDSQSPAGQGLSSD